MKSYSVDLRGKVLGAYDRALYLNSTLSRVSGMVLTAADAPSLTPTIASYRYNGVGTLIEQREGDTTDIVSSLDNFDSYDQTSNPYRTYPNLDRFNRVTRSRWDRNLSTSTSSIVNAKYYDLTITGYDYDSNITGTTDWRYSQFSSGYTMD